MDDIVYKFNIGDKVFIKKHKQREKMGVILKRFPAGVTTFDNYYLVRDQDKNEAYYSEDTTRANHITGLWH